MTGIKEFDKEVEPKNRQCLFCEANPPDDLRTTDMRGGKAHWFSSCLLSVRLRRIARFYLCPKHQSRKVEACQWAKDGFAEEEIADLKGMNAVRVWLSYHPELRRYIER